MPTPVLLEGYDTAWPRHFEKAADELCQLLGLPVSAVEHVGSTAVAGLNAKPLIDIDITLPEGVDITGMAALLESAGYTPRGSRHGDGVFAFVMRGNPGRRVYLCPKGSQTHADRIAFRNALRQNADLSFAYGLLKQELAALYPQDGDRYTQAKGRFIQSVTRAHVTKDVALVPEFAVTDWQISRAFYTWLLGFSIAYERPEEGFSYLTLGSAELMIDQIGIGRTFEIAGAAMERPFGRGLNVQILVEDVDAILQRLAEAGIALYLPLEEKWYRKDGMELGNRQFVVADPDGYLLRLFEDLGARPVGSA
ncbi:GrpB-like predicted nucleotidyltransferase (UPF0157 family)/catechol 2,3-dioxygenase-like lactoylglutathione lyase family enzyme [Rhizobium taibaishanense]|uniref:Bleomycin resistance protein n=1 Tax=Allorhizobium taibaishanense TaxID=887144 RepID=A0A7W6HKZ6_9HYPH|nr:GrpB-like predicted nucleotidyltransferase (UPF0157 family)/catechol 2,3-dioxygenase-like lactoylglutathione lyase family enzyme [Allorhizobium taibaishanense]